MIKVFYNDKQTARGNESFSPSAGKPELVVESWGDLGLPIKIKDFKPSTRKQISKVHSKNYVDGILDLKLANGFGNKLKSVAEALPWVCGSMVAACRYAAKTKEICASPTSGSHHAMYGSSQGFCTFGSLILGAHEALASGKVRKVGLLDVDNHAGNGSEDLIRKNNLKIAHWSLGYSDVTSNNVEEWLDGLPKFLEKFYKGCGLIIFNAGADSHIDDPLGGRFTTEQMKRRDKIVFEYCVKHRKGCVFALAGGYSTPIRKVLDLHDNTMIAACEAVGII